MSTGGQSIAMIFAGALVIMAGALFRRDQRRRQEDILVAAGFTIFIAGAASAHMWLISRTPITIDERLLRLDRSLGLDTLRIAFRLQRLHLVPLLSAIYAALSIVMGLSWSLERNWRMLLACILGGLLCFPFYAAFPAVGPGWYDWRLHVPAPVPRNCVPSMHLTWALLLAMNARHPALRYPLWLYAALLGTATITLGQHYFIDLALAVPNAVALQFIAERCSRHVPGRSRDLKDALASELAETK